MKFAGPALTALLFAALLPVMASAQEKAAKTNAEIESEAKLRIAAFKTPDDIDTRLYVDELQTANPSAICFDDKGRLYIAEIHRWREGVEDIRNEAAMLFDDVSIRSTADRLAMYEKHALYRPLSYYSQLEDRIVVVEDTDKDGRADKSSVYADGFNDPLDGPGIGLIHRDNRIYYTNIPHLWMLEDKDGDGKAEQRISIQEGFGPRMSLSGHDMHGLVWGMDGKLYWSIGDRGYSFTTKEGRHYEKPNEGAVFRCNPDGSEVEVFYEGLRNPQELAIDAYGNLFTCDNTADAWDKGRLVYILEGGTTGWTAAHQSLLNFRNQLGVRTPDYRHPEQKSIPMNPWMTEGLWEKPFDGRPDWVLPPIDYISWGPSGLVYNYGATALPERYDSHFFVCNFGGSKGDLETWSVENDGAGFKTVDHHVFMEGAGNTDVEFGPDGRMYLSCFNNNGWYKEDIGNVYALYNEDALKDTVVLETHDLLLQNFDDKAPDALDSLLEHKDLRVRQRAQFALAKKANAEARATLESAARESGNLFKRLHGIWGLGQLAAGGQADLYAVHISLLKDDNAEVRAQAAKVLIDADTPEAGAALTATIGDESARVRAFAAIGAGKNGATDATDALFGLLAENADADAFVRHAAIQGLTYLGNADALLVKADDESVAVRRGALLALRKLHDPQIKTFLDDADASIRNSAIRAIHDLDLGDAMPDLAAVIEQSFAGAENPAAVPANHRDQILHNRLINANFRLGKTTNAERLLKYAANTALPALNREQALAALEEWPAPTIVDAVTAQFRPLDPATRDDIGATVRIHLGPVLDDAEGPLLTRALQVAVQYGAEIPTPLLTSVLKNAKADTELRVQSIKSLAKSDPGALDTLTEALLSDAKAPVRAEATRALVSRDAARGLDAALTLARSENLRDRQNGYAILADINDAKVTDFFKNQLDVLLAGKEPVGSQLDLLEAAEKLGNPDIAAKLAAWNASLDPGDPLAAYQVALDGGDPEIGQELYLTHAAAQCNKCHKVGKTGGIAGPELTDLGTRQKAPYILESLINPSAIVVPGYGITILTLKDGTSIGATLLEESDTELTLKNPDGSIQKIAAADIATRQPPMSAMPPMIAFLKKREIRDLVAYLSTLKGKSSTGH